MNIYSYIIITITIISLHYSLIVLIMADLNQIKIVLVKKKRTGKWLAEQLGKSTCTISKWCSNTTQPDIPTLARIAKLLEVNVKDLLNDSEQ